MWTLFWLAVLAAVAVTWLMLARSERPKEWAEDAQSQANRRAFLLRARRPLVPIPPPGSSGFIRVDYGSGESWSARVIGHRDQDGTVVIESVEQFLPGVDPDDIPAPGV